MDEDQAAVLRVELGVLVVEAGKLHLYCVVLDKHLPQLNFALSRVV